MNSSKTTDEELFCRKAGGEASPEINSDFLQIREGGVPWQEEFVSECNAGPGSFRKPVKRRKVKDFACDAIMKNVKTKDLKIREFAILTWSFAILCFIAENGFGPSLISPTTPLPPFFSKIHTFIRTYEVMLTKS